MNGGRVRDEARATLALALPIALGQAAWMVMGLVDAALVGHVSSGELAAVSIGNAIFFPAMCPAMGVTMAVEPLASQAVGAGDDDRAFRSVVAGMVACALLALPTVALIVAVSYAAAWVGVEPSILPAARRYLLGRLPGVLPWLAYMAAKAYLEAKGRTQPIVWGSLAANVLNFGLCGTLVFGDDALAFAHLPRVGLPALGALGAGVATSVSSTFMAVVTIAAALRLRPAATPIVPVDRAPLVATTRKLLRVGIPIGLQVVTEAGVFGLVSLVAGRFGPRIAAAHQIALGLASLTFMGTLGIAAATAVRVGRAIGAEEEHGPRRAGNVGLGLIVIYTLLCAVAFVCFARPLAGLFSSDPLVLAPATSFLGIAALFQLADGIQGVAGGGLRGAADTRFASVANVCAHWLIGLPVALVTAFWLGWGPRGLWWGLTTGLFVVAAVLTWRFRRITAARIAAI